MLVAAQSNDLPDISDEAHVEHTVGFIEHQHGNGIQPDVSLIAKIEQTPGSRDQDIHAGPESFDLLPLANAAKDHCGPQLGMAPIGVDAIADLTCQFACRRQDERARRAWLTRCVVEGQSIQDRQ